MLAALFCLYAWASPAAKIGAREYSEQELKDGFSAYLQYQNREKLSEADSLALWGRYFDELIAMYIYNDAIAEGAVEVSEAELEQEIMRNVPQGIKLVEDFSTHGVFDISKYHKALKENPQFKQSVLDFSRDVYAYKKLLQKIRSEVKIDSSRVKEEWLAKGHSARAKIIHFDPNILQDIEASEEDARKLYDENIDEYRKENGRSLRYVAFRGLNSRENAGKKQELQQMAAQLLRLAQKKGLNNAAAELNLQVEESPYFSQEDEIIRGVARDPQLVSTVFAADPGTLLELYHSPFGDIFVAEAGPQKAEYYSPFDLYKPILLLQARAMARSATMRERVKQFIAENNFESYLSSAEAQGYPIIEQEDIRLNSQIPGIGQSEALNRACLATGAGEFSPLVEQDGHFFLAKVEEREIRNARTWQLKKAEILHNARIAAENAHLDSWYLNRRDALEIVYPKILRQ